MSPATALSPPPTANTAKCQNCGAEVHSDEAKRRITELEAQVRILSEKATNAVDKLADYEDELKALRPTPPSSSSSSSSLTSNTPSGITSATNRISAFLTASSRGRGGPPSPPPDSNSTEVLLEKERKSRVKAEERLEQVTGELEELSASLFQSANEMVANERQQKSKLEERVRMLESRDEEAKKRLGVLESAMDRIVRVRQVLSVS
ncbi:unnamed protein product [Tuber aestivum]|uniref:GDP/GTP exchange factor Sec2 N-terminal domain-containing protein n=1 Tax=Tuber aestivum TaxID=59557 RepID=A0A292Q927_9PEZI|nr:unnamed protein product [Tuber aestivum]